jgi:hypothetical protein
MGDSNDGNINVYDLSSNTLDVVATINTGLPSVMGIAFFRSSPSYGLLSSSTTSANIFYMAS